MNESFQPYLHQDDVVFLGCGDDVFHLSGVHSLEEQQMYSAVLCVQHSKVHNVSEDTDVPGSVRRQYAISSACAARPIIALNSYLLIADVILRNTMLLADSSEHSKLDAMTTICTKERQTYRHTRSS